MEDWDEIFEQALDFADGDEDVAMVLATVHWNSGNRFFDDTAEAVGYQILEDMGH